MLEELDNVKRMNPKCLVKFPTLQVPQCHAKLYRSVTNSQAYYDRMSSRPNLKEYWNSDAHQKTQINGVDRV